MLEDMSCRTGPLRVGLPLRGVCTDLAAITSVDPPVARGHLSSDQGEDRSTSIQLYKIKSHGVAAPRVVGPSGRTFSSIVSRWNVE
jgi:hypothetical protein